MKKIAWEEHYGTEEIFFMRSNWLEANGYPVSPPKEKLMEIGKYACDIEKYRLPDMDKYGIAIQVLMPGTAGIERLPDVAMAVDAARASNDNLAEVIARWPDRFSGIATLPLQDPEACCREMERCKADLHLPAACITGHIQGAFIDEPKYDCLWETAQRLGMLLSFHPTDAPPEHTVLLQGHDELLASTWSWGVEASTYVLRILFAGIFDRYPQTQLIVGHMGEMLPFFMWRVENRFRVTPAGVTLDLPPTAYFKRNIYVNTSGVFYGPALKCTIDFMGADRILFAVDYPFESNATAAQFIDTVDISEADREKICYKNSLALLGKA